MMSQQDDSSDGTARRVRDVVGSLVPGGPRDVQPTDDLARDLGFDSLAMVELALALEVEFDLQAIPEGQAVSMETVADIEDVIAALTTGTSPLSGLPEAG
jgi:acyl carrier protein